MIFGKSCLLTRKIASILVPFDNSSNSKRALDQALSIAQMSHSGITLVYVVSYHGVMGKIIGPYKGTLISHITKFLETAKRNASLDGIDASFKILYGNAAEEILGMIRKGEFDLVVVGRRGTNKQSGPLLGSVSNALVQNSKTPVLVVT